MYYQYQVDKGSVTRWTTDCIWPGCTRRPWGTEKHHLISALRMLGYAETESGWVCREHLKMARAIGVVTALIP